MSQTKQESRSRAGRAAQRGLTLVEVLIAGLISSLLLVGIYFVFISNSESFYRQEQALQVQERLRFSMEYVKNDLRNLGRLTVLNGDLPTLEQVQGPLPYRAVTLNEAGPTEGWPQVILDNGMRPDTLRLLVDASGATPLAVESVSNNEIYIQSELYQTTRAAKALVQPGAGAAFDALFSRPALAYVRSTVSGKFALARIEGAQFNGGTPILTIDGSRPTGLATECAMSGCTVNPVHLIEYAVVADPEDELRTRLVRRRLDPGNPDLAPDRRHSVVIADYVVDFQVWGTYDTRGIGELIPVIPADSNLLDDCGNWSGGCAPASTDEADHMNAQLHRLRAFNILLSVRTPREDASFRLEPLLAEAGAIGASQTLADRVGFSLGGDPAMTGYARVSTMLSEVETPNMNRGGL